MVKSVAEQKAESARIESAMKVAREQTFRRRALTKEFGAATAGAIIRGEPIRPAPRAIVGGREMFVGAPEPVAPVIVKRPSIPESERPIKVPRPAFIRTEEPFISPDIFLQGTTPTQRLLELEEKRRLEFELSRTIEKGLRTPVRQKLGTGFPNVPEQIKTIEEVILGIGTPLFLTADPGAREQAIKIAKKSPEKVFALALESAAFPILAGAEVVKEARRTIGKEGPVLRQETGIGRVFGKGAAAFTVAGVAAATGVLIPKIIPKGRVLKGVAKPTKIKLKPKRLVTTRDFLKETILKEAKAPQPPKITRVIDKGNSVEFIIEAGGKIIERRIVAKTDTAVLKAQLGAAKLQGAKFIGISKPVSKPTTGLGPIAFKKGEISFFEEEQIIQAAPGFEQLITPAPKKAVIAPAIQPRFQSQFLAAESAQRQATLEAQSQLAARTSEQAILQSRRLSERQISGMLDVQVQAQTQAQKQQQAFKEQQLLEQRPRAPRAIRKAPRRGAFGFPILLDFPAARVAPAAVKGKPGYDTFIKRRGRIEKINRVPRTKKGALSIGAIEVDNTPVASFTIRKSKKLAEIDGGAAWATLKHKFSPRKTKNALELVEKAAFRIDMPGELRGITQKGIDIRRAI